MLERPPTVVAANVVPVGTIACPRNSSPGGFEPPSALTAALPAGVTARTSTSAMTVNLSVRMKASPVDGGNPNASSGRARVERDGRQHDQPPGDGKRRVQDVRDLPTRPPALEDLLGPEVVGKVRDAVAGRHREVDADGDAQSATTN